MTALDRLRNICNRLGISISEACRRADVSRDTVMDWSTNNPNAINLLKMAKALNVDPMELVRDDEQ